MRGLSLLLLPALCGATRVSTFARFAGGIRSLQDGMIAQAKAADPTASWCTKASVGFNFGAPSRREMSSA